MYYLMNFEERVIYQFKHSESGVIFTRYAKGIWSETRVTGEEFVLNLASQIERLEILYEDLESQV